MVRVNAKQSAREAKAAMYRQLVLDAAEAEFAERGYDEAKIQDVARRAGIALGTLYAVFPSKNDIYVEVQRRRGRELLRAVAARTQGAESALSLCLAGIEAYVRFMTQHVGYLRMHLREGMAWSERENLSGEQAATWEQGMALSQGLFRLAIEQGDLYPGDPALLVRMMTAAHQVQLKHWVDGGADAAALDALIEDLLAYFLRAFVRPEAAARVREAGNVSPAVEERHANGDL